MAELNRGGLSVGFVGDESPEPAATAYENGMVAGNGKRVAQAIEFQPEKQAEVKNMSDEEYIEAFIENGIKRRAESNRKVRATLDAAREWRKKRYGRESNLVDVDPNA